VDFLWHSFVLPSQDTRFRLLIASAVSLFLLVCFVCLPTNLSAVFFFPSFAALRGVCLLGGELLRLVRESDLTGLNFSSFPSMVYEFSFLFFFRFFSFSFFTVFGLVDRSIIGAVGT